MIADPATFIRSNTALIAPPLVSEIRLHLATEVVPLWRKTEEELEAEGVPPPYWAFAWAGGQALARYLLDHRDVVRNKRVLDFGSGSGLVAIAAAMAGAREILAADIDPIAAEAIALNYEANDLHSRLLVTTRSLIDSPCAWDVILVGDMCYERPLAERLLHWLEHCRRAGAMVLLGDPGRSYFPKSGITKLATYRVQTTRELEDREIRETSVCLYDGSLRP
jgi:predicted nicotinamide N-methyase